MLPPTIFFFVILHIVIFTRALMDEQYGIEIPTSVSATIAALIVGKAILITDALPFVNWFRKSRLIYNVVWRIFLYICLIFVFQFLEELIPVIHNYETVQEGVRHTIEEIKWHRFWASYTLLSVFLAIYIISTELIGALGRDKSLKLFFGNNKIE
jgi:hypothetical protein